MLDKSLWSPAMSPSPRSSRLPLVLALVASLVAVSTLLVAPLSAQPQPKAFMEKLIHDFGAISRGDKVTTTFEIENRGEAPLELTEVRVACACTVVDYSREIAPGETGQITVELDSTSVDGPTTQRMQVFTNDPDAARIDLAVQADSRPLIRAEPGFVRYVIVQGFDDTKNDPTVRQKIFARTHPEFQITRVESPLPFISASFRKPTAEELTEEQKPLWIVETRISPEAQVGALSGYLKVYTDHPDQEVLPIPMSGFVRPVIAVTPPHAKFGDIVVGNPDEPAEGSVQLRNFAVESIAVTGASTDIRGLETEVRVHEEGRYYYVHLRLTSEMAKGEFDGTVTVTTDSPRAPELTFRVSGNVK